MARALAILGSLALALGVAACGGESGRRPAPAPPPPQYGPPQYGPAPAPGPPPPYGQQPAPPVAAPQPPAQAPVGYDPINAVDMGFLRNTAGSVLKELVAALPQGPQSRVAAIPFVFDASPGRVNAYAACIDGKALLAVTDGLLDVAAHLAQARACDEVFGTRKLDAYIQLLAREQRPDQPLVRPPPGFFTDAELRDGRRVARQHDVFAEVIAFVIAHELAHHHLGHLPCTAVGGMLGAGEIARAVSDAVPLFNQPNELAADAAGTNNVLAAGARRAGYRWTEGGALLTMQFFAGLDTASPLDVIFAFERTHPSPLVRIPVIQQTANLYRIGGGGWLPIPSFSG